MKKLDPRRLLAPLLVLLGVFLVLAQSASGKIELRSEITDSGIFLSGPSRVGQIIQTSLNPRLANRASPTNHASDLSDWLSREPLGEGESLNLYAYCHGDPINKVDVLGLASVLVDVLPGMPDGIVGSGGGGHSISGIGEEGQHHGFTLGLFEGTSPAEWARIDAVMALEAQVKWLRPMQSDVDYFNTHFAPASPRHPSSRPGRVGLDGILYELAGAPEGIINFAFQEVLMGAWSSSVALIDGNGYNGFGKDVSRLEGGVDLAFWLVPGFIDDLGKVGMRGQRVISSPTQMNPSRMKGHFLDSGRQTKHINQFSADEYLAVLDKHEDLISRLSVGFVELPKGTASAQLMGELTLATSKEIGLWRLVDGRRVLTMGTRNGISLPMASKKVRRLVAHTHPSGNLKFSNRLNEFGEEIGDIPRFLEFFPDQASSVLIGPSGMGIRLMILG
ncbi:MAG: hypothetical protein ACI9NQ_000138 [Paracoccaceae bacterium]